MQIWKSHYRDELHDTDIEILNDGSEISFTLDGFKFCSRTEISDFEYESAEQSDEIENKFHVSEFHGDMLYDFGKRIPMYFYLLHKYALDIEIPVHVVRKSDTAEITGTINISFQLVENDTIVRNFSLYVDGKCYSSEKYTLDFEIALSDICRKIKNDYYIRSCFTCQYSEYSPYGQTGFGSMMCYLECKEKCLMVNSKADYFKYLMDENFTHRQETYLCSEYDSRNKCGGYRGFVDI